jgi:hypothetical protein
MAKERIEYGMSTLDMVMTMTEGNPGAIATVNLLLKDAHAYDPDNGLGGLGALLSLDTAEIYGSRIWALYKDVCDQHLGRMIGVIRAKQLGIIDKATLDHAIDNYGEGLDLDTVLAAVREQLPSYRVLPA